MIILQPSARVKRETGINFDVFETLLTNMLEFNHKKNLNISVIIHKSKVRGTSFCTPVSIKDYRIELDTTKPNKRYIFGSLLHEIRHCIQNNLFNFWNDDILKTWKAYYFSKEEIDARKMERLTTQFIKYYDAFMKMEEQFKDLKLSKIS